ncbi:MAG: hypothetical protein KA715_10450 [Xanthomonadaceae bacterium]|nr:hypothetical protein [Xanthomonadaceae bacterium]
MMTFLMGLTGWAKEPKSVVILTHASTEFDAYIESRTGIPSILKIAKKLKLPVFHLYKKETAETYPFLNCKKNHCLESSAGEFSVPITSNHVIVMGGHWGQCLDITLDSLMNIWSQKQGENLKITLITDGIYVSNLIIRHNDPYHTEFNSDILAQANEVMKTLDDAEPYLKMSLDQLLRIIEKYEEPSSYQLRVQFLRRKLPRYLRLSSEYRVVLKIGPEYSEIIKTGLGENGPTLTLEYL